jgi:hypothetical protein
MQSSTHFPSGDWSKALYKQKTTPTEVADLLLKLADNKWMSLIKIPSKSFL